MNKKTQRSIVILALAMEFLSFLTPGYASSHSKKGPTSPVSTLDMKKKEFESLNVCLANYRDSVSKFTHERSPSVLLDLEKKVSPYVLAIQSSIDRLTLKNTNLTPKEKQDLSDIFHELNRIQLSFDLVKKPLQPSIGAAITDFCQGKSDTLVGF